MAANLEEYLDKHCLGSTAQNTSKNLTTFLLDTCIDKSNVKTFPLAVYRTFLTSVWDDSMKEELSLHYLQDANDILGTVPNQKEFLIALKALTMWTKVRGLDSQVYGYLGGMTVSVILAKVAKLFPNTTASILVEKFFLVLQEWPWPKAITLGNIGIDQSMCDFDELDVMIVLNRSGSNLACNVIRSSFTEIMREVSAAHKICKEIKAVGHDWSAIDST